MDSWGPRATRQPGNQEPGTRNLEKASTNPCPHSGPELSAFVNTVLTRLALLREVGILVPIFQMGKPRFGDFQRGGAFCTTPEPFPWGAHDLEDTVSLRFRGTGVGCEVYKLSKGQQLGHPFGQNHACLAIIPIPGAFLS